MARIDDLVRSQVDINTFLLEDALTILDELLGEDFLAEIVAGLDDEGPQSPTRETSEGA